MPSDTGAMQRTTLYISNMHCPSCVATITTLLTSAPVSLPEAGISISLLTGLVELDHPNLFDLQVAIRTLKEAGFDLGQPDEKELRTSTGDAGQKRWFESRKSRTKRVEKEAKEEQRRAEAHLASCNACQEWNAGQGKGKAKECAVTMAPARVRTELLIEGMTCSSCVGTVARTLSKDEDERIITSTVTLVPGRAIVEHFDSLSGEDMLRMLEDGGYDGEVIRSEKLSEPDESNNWTETRVAIEGMTCASCVGTVNDILSALSSIRSFTVTLLPALAVVIHNPALLSGNKIVSEIEDGGYEAEIVSSSPVGVTAKEGNTTRSVKLRIEGMFCDKCSGSLNALMSDLQQSGDITTFTPLSLESPSTVVNYEAQPPDGFTLRTLRHLITSKGPFSLHVVRTADVMTQLARQAQAREAKAMAVRVLTTLAFAIPTFLIAIVFMSLLSPSHHLRRYFEAPIWGSASRGTVALFVLATPVQFGVGSLFYFRAWKSLRGVWRRKSWRDRLLRWGSMDSLVALGTTSGWVASVVFMALDVVTPVQAGMGSEMGYFDSSIFLMLFILAGRWLEGVSRQKTGEAVEELGRMKPASGVLWVDDGKEEAIDEKRGSYSIESLQEGTSATSSVVAVDFLERGDIILISSGSAVPLDAVLLPSSSTSNFDESSLTGESKPVTKSPSDTVFAGSTNLGPSAVVARVLSGPGETMMDGIVSAVRDAMARKASIERVADSITGYFVPVIVGIACMTFGIWIVRGYSGNLPFEWLEGDVGRKGGWALFAVQFTVAVLVVACPCGIGLAAPTAQMVGTGIAAKLGIVPYGGGEAFQNATQIDCVVFDKTGTITCGTFEVSHHRVVDSTFDSDEATLWNLIDAIEDTSSHPISLGIRKFCQVQLSSRPVTGMRCLHSEEVPGRGLFATVVVGGDQLDVVIGNQPFMEEKGVDFATQPSSTLSDVDKWGREGATVLFVASRRPSVESFTLTATIAIQDPARYEASRVVKELEKLGILSFMCTGDNRATALTVARQVGIPDDRVFAEIMPVGKQECIQAIQRGSVAAAVAEMRRRKRWHFGVWKSKARAKVLFVGDGINDTVALAQADVGVSMGTGAAIALSSSDFCLLSSDLLSLLTVLALAKSTYRKILTNFAWACCFNTVLIPVAAGAFYDLGRTRLPPVWASLAMALSSVSVVGNSLLLRWTFSTPAAARPRG